ncbi:hypothetical protein EAI_00637 [Harpegnathos saltator]|uniref:Protein takeout n=2 Tax=Harpegnathos saltator TaxID=610380 RepID=E2BWR5_HARSA|nr:hypothetical protein EAI_00637 [Harpegnathos saltator]
MKPYLMQGVSRLNISSFEPYYVKFQKIDFQNRFVRLMKCRDTLVNGITNFTIREVNVSDKNDYIQFLAYFPFVNVFTKLDPYALIGSTFIKSSRYDLSSNITNVTAEIIIQGANFEDGENKMQYFSVDNVTVVFRNIGEVFTKKEQKGRGSSSLTQVANDYFLREWESLTSELNHYLEDVVAEMIQIISTKIYMHFPIDVLMTR